MGQSPRVRVVIQARTSSTRLPAKVLLPIGDLPLSVLIARRLARGGGDVVLATSNDRSDDLLCSCLARHDLNVVRGPLDDVLGRYVLAVSDLSDEDICVRATGDNPFPDADFVAEAVQLFSARGKPYGAVGSKRIGLPYGCTVEVFRVGQLRKAGRLAVNAYEREHVTPWMRSQDAACDIVHDFGFPEEIGAIACTVDALEDYLKVASIFDRCDDAVGVHWRDLVRLLVEAKTNALPVNSDETPPGLVLGTAQLGMAYGRANKFGLPTEDEASAILAEAKRQGVRRLDTARDYGMSERRIGAFGWGSDNPDFSIGTKLDKLDLLGMTSNKEISSAVIASVERSLVDLRLKSIPLLSLHYVSHLWEHDGVVWKTLVELKARGLIGSLGCSVQNPAELQLALEAEHVAYVQLPFNVLDWRWDPFVDALTERTDLIIDVRSSLLQGVLTPLPAERWPEAGRELAPRIITELKELVAQLRRVSVPDLCFAYVRSHRWIDGVVVGSDTIEHLKDNIALFNRPPLTQSEAAYLKSRLPTASISLLDPSTWGQQSNPEEDRARASR